MKERVTAIRRTKMSAPMRWLVEKDLIKKPALDFGCGYGEDAALLNMDSYDPYFQPELPAEQFKTVTCIYVLNTLSKNKEQEVINQIKKKLLPGGTAFLAVRRDLKNKTKTQRIVKLDLPVITEVKGRFIIYEMN